MANHPGLYGQSPVYECIDDDLRETWQPTDITVTAQDVGSALNFDALSKIYARPSFHGPDCPNITLSQPNSLSTALGAGDDLNASLLPSTPSFIPRQTPIILTVPQRPWAGKRFVSHNITSNSICLDMDNGATLNAADALDHRYTGLICRNTAIPFEGTSIYLRFEWPDYSSWTRQIKTLDWKNSRNPIVGVKLANEIAKSLKIFIERVQDQVVTGADLQWKVGRVGSKYISVEDIEILLIHRVSKASWQAEFGLIC